MASLRMLLKSRTFSLPVAFRRSLSVNRPFLASDYHSSQEVVPIREEGVITRGFPAGTDRTEINTDDALTVKEQGPWSELTKEDRIAIYRAQFAKTVQELHIPDEPDDNPLAISLALVVCGIGVATYYVLHHFCAPPPMITESPEWKAAELEKMKVYRVNSIWLEKK